MVHARKPIPTRSTTTKILREKGRSVMASPSPLPRPPRPPPPLRRTRFVCISDTHNTSPADAGYRLPPGDVLIHAGDLTKAGRWQELRKTLRWIDEADYEAKIVVAGNHDLSLDAEFCARNRTSWFLRKQSTSSSSSSPPQEHDTPIDFAKEFPSITYLENASATIELRGKDPSGSSSAAGPGPGPGPARARFKVFGSPYSRSWGNWAFQYARAPEDAGERFWRTSSSSSSSRARIPADADVVVAHGPPRGHCDATITGEAAGCEALRRALWRVRPKLVVCGHIHEARGADRIVWDLGGDKEEEGERDGRNSNKNNNGGDGHDDGGDGGRWYAESRTERWAEDDSSRANKKKLARLDVSSRSGRPLQNSDAASTDEQPPPPPRAVNDSDGGSSSDTEVEDGDPEKPPRSETVSSWLSSWMMSGVRWGVGYSVSTAMKGVELARSWKESSSFFFFFFFFFSSSFAVPVSTASASSSASAVRREIQDALQGRLGRKETLVVNAAIMASSFPYRGAGGDRYNKPIVVDLDLPVVYS